MDSSGSNVNGSVFYRSTQDDATLGRVQEMIANITLSYADFQPSLAVIVTWDSVELPVLVR